jgi:hypothetical protein
MAHHRKINVAGNNEICENICRQACSERRKSASIEASAREMAKTAEEGSEASEENRRLKVATAAK